MNNKGHGDFSGLIYALLGFAVTVFLLIIGTTYGIGRLIVKWTGKELTATNTVLLVIFAIALILAALKYFAG